MVLLLPHDTSSCYNVKKSAGQDKCKVADDFLLTDGMDTLVNTNTR
jgi:hypothetical protein